MTNKRKSFFMQSKEVFKHLEQCIREDSDFPNASFSVYTHLLSLKNYNDNYSQCSLRELKSDLGISLPTASKAIDKLEFYGFIISIRVKGYKNMYFFPLEEYFLKDNPFESYNRIFESKNQLSKWEKYYENFLKNCFI